MKPKASEIIRAACQIVGIEPNEMFDKTHPDGSRRALRAKARTIAAGGLRHLTMLSYPEIHAVLGLRGQSGAYDAMCRFDSMDGLDQADCIAEMLSIIRQRTIGDKENNDQRSGSRQKVCRDDQESQHAELVDARDG